jgi:hypothetical protein
MMSRKFGMARFGTVAAITDDAATVEWIMAVSHTRTGPGDMRIPGKSEKMKVKFKQRCLYRVLSTLVAAAPTRGRGSVEPVRIMLGDQNLDPDEVHEIVRMTRSDAELSVLGSDGIRCKHNNNSMHDHHSMTTTSMTIA